MNNRLWLLIAATVLTMSTFAASIETDRTWYLAGEAMKVSVTDDDAMIAYAELCDTYSLAAGVIVSLKGGVGRGVIELPSNLHSGYYVLSVYTRHKAKVAHRLVAIVNPLRKSDDDNIEWTKTTHPDSLSFPSTGEREKIDAQSSIENGQWSMVNDQWAMFNVRETEGHIIKARVKNVYHGHFFTGNEIRPSISIVGKQIHYFEGKMVNDSMAVFYTYGIYGKQPLVLSAASSTGVSLPIEIISPFATMLPKELPHLVFHYNRSEVEFRSISMQRHQMAIAPAKHANDLWSPAVSGTQEQQEGNYSDETAEDGVPLDYNETLFGTKPDLTYNLDEYRQFLTIREVLLEYVNCVRNRKIDGVPQLFVRKEQGAYNSSWPAKVLIDGMPVIDIERLLNYDARRIHYINIYSGQYTFGNGVFNGILSFITRSGRLTNYPIERNMQYLVYEFPEPAL